MLPDAAEQYYLEQQVVMAGIVRRARSLWAQLDIANLDGSWRTVGRRMTGVVSAGQALAANGADLYLDSVLTELGIDNTATAAVDASAFAGVASDGRSLDTLLYQPVIAAKVATIARSDDAMFGAEASLIRIVTTQLQDASRGSLAAGIAARRSVTGYVRMLNPPSCGRCAVLAGKRFKWNTGFLRHPHCDCRHIPTDESVAGDVTTDPRAYFDSLPADLQNRYFGEGGAGAIREGADIGQVVNARRGMTAAGTTLEGTTRRGFAGRRRGANTRASGLRFGNTTAPRARSAPRLMPERIMATARDRADAVDQLRRHGYLI